MPYEADWLTQNRGHSLAGFSVTLIGRIEVTAEEVIPETQLRDPSITKQELEDLLNYLNGLPAEMRRSGAFTAYEQRVAELKQELILSEK